MAGERRGGALGSKRTYPVQTEDVGGEKSPSDGRPRLLALGGCTILELMDRLQDQISYTHYWRHNIVCDMGGDIDPSKIDLDHPDARRLLQKHAIKLHRGLIAAGDFDALIIECASDMMFSFLRVGDGILPDVRNDLFSEGWADISFAQCAMLREAAPLLTYEQEYWDLWKQGFTRLYDESLAAHVRAGKKILFVQRLLCDHHLTEAGPDQFANPVADLNDILRGIYAFLGGFPGLTLITPPRELHFSSPFSPWSGPFEMHPEREYYGYVGEEILRACVGEEAANAYRVRCLTAHAQERVTPAIQAQGLQAMLDAKVSEMDAQSAWIDAQSSRIIALSTVLSATEAKLDACEAHLRHSLTDRERLAQRVALLEKRYAPVRRIYKGLKLGQLRRWLKGKRSAS